MPNTDSQFQGQIDTIRLEGIIREEFAKMQGKFDLHTQELKSTAETMNRAISKLERHLEDPSLHKCVEHDSDINNCFKIGRSNSENINLLQKSVLGIKADEKVLQGQIRILKWAAGVLVGFALVAKEMIIWFMNR